MMSLNKSLISGASVFVLALSLSACNDGISADATKEEAKAEKAERVVVVERSVCANCGTVSGIDEIKTKGSGSGIGAVTGAVIGGVVGHQFGSGKGNDAATVAGAAGGAYAGHQAEKQYNATISYRVTVSMDGGGTRTVTTAGLNGVGVGSKVKVNGDNLTPM